jgi:hypothetical protein
MINDNVMLKKKKENNVMVFGLKVFNDDVVVKVKYLLQKKGFSKV